MKKLLTLLAVSALICSCNSEKEREEDNRTIITGQVVNFTAEHPKVILWSLYGAFSDDTISEQLSEDGKFRFESDDIHLQQNMLLMYGDIIDFFVAPGDSIHIEIDAAKMEAGISDAISFSGDKSELNNFYHDNQHIIDIKYSLINDFRSNNQKNIAIKPKAMVEIFEKIVNVYNDSIAAYIKQKQTAIPDGLRDFYQRDMIFGLSNNIYNYQQDNINLKLELLADPFFRKDDSLNFCTLEFTSYLSLYSDTKRYSDTMYVTTSKQGNYSETLRNTIRILKSEPVSLSRDVMIWQRISRVIKSNPKLYDSIPEIRNAFTTPQINAKFAKFAQRYKNLDFAETPINGISYMESDGTVNELSKVDMFKHLSEKHPNKVLYVDVYATWCSPCKAEMKNSAPALHDAMKGKDVEFINLCLSSELDVWEKMVKEYGLTENYWFSDDATNMFMSVYKIGGFPTYILVGKDGKISTLSAARPSSLSKITEQINELLKN